MGSAVVDATGNGAKPTLETVAEVAGVSRATVSRVINNFPKVSRQVRDAVEQAINSTGYVPNRAARSLVTRRTESIALAVFESGKRLLSDPYLMGIVRAVSDELSHTDMQLVLLLASPPERVVKLENYLRGGHVDGVLLVSAHGSDPLPAPGVPAVIGGRPLVPRRGTVWVDCDNVGGGRAAVEHLLERGRRRIATIAGPRDMCAGIDRLTGYREALGRRRRPIVAYGDFGQESGECAMTELLRREPGIDAVFVASDLMAEGALAALRAAGRRVPADVAVVGFDDNTSSRYTDPPLTTIRQPWEEQGRLMTRLLLRRINEGAKVESMVLPTQLVVRGST